MGTQSDSKNRKARSRNIGIQSAQSKGVLESHLKQVLFSIATLLIGSGYGYRGLSKLAREAFVRAATTVLREKSGKINQARIAASTGLTRIEVSRILNKSNSHLKVDSENRPVNVAAGWISDKDFLDARKRPRPLRFKGGRYDFATLVKKYSGDIPVRAMLVEMQRLGMVSHDVQGIVRLIRPAIEISKTTASLMRAVSPWIALLEENVQRKPHGNLSSNTHKVDLFFDSIPQINAVMRELRARRVAFIQGLSELGTKTEREGHLALRITVAVAAARPVQARKNRT